MSANHVPPENNLKYQVFYDPCRAAPGCVPTDDLPDVVKRLCAATPEHPNLTFVFDGKLSNIRSTILWDSGAAVSVLSKSFAKLHKLSTKPSDTAIQLANGTIVESAEVIDLRLRIQKHQSKVRFVVTELMPGYDGILGTDWLQAQEVVARYGTTPTRGVSPQPPSIFLARTGCVIYPGTEPACEQATPVRSSVITACAAAKLLQAPKFGSATPFVVLTRAADKGKQTPHQQNSRLCALLQQYEDVFLAPSLTGTGASTLGDPTPECIPIIPGSTPYNRPPFRLSPKDKAKIERQVVEALGNGWIERSSSAYGAPVLFVPKPDGSLRMCIDYRGLNKIAVKNKFPMPRIDDLTENLAGSKYFSTLDLAAGYHQLKLQQTDVPKTAFNTYFGKI